MRDDHQFRSTLLIRRLSFVSLLKISFIAGLGFFAPFCLLGLLVAAFSPGSVRMEEGQTMTHFVLMLLSMLILGPAMFAVSCGVGTWVVMGVKSLFSPTSIEIVRDDRDLSLDEPVESTGEAVEESRRPTLKLVEMIRKPAFLIPATAVVTAVLCYFAFSSRSIADPEFRLSIASPDGTRVALVSTVESSFGEFRFVVQSVEIARQEGVGAILQKRAKKGLGPRGHSVASIHSCENDHIDVSWTSDRELKIRYSQTRTDWVSSVAEADGVSVTLEAVPKVSPDAP